MKRHGNYHLVIYRAFNSCTSWLYHLQGFWYFAPSRSREFQLNPRNPAKFTRTHEIPWNLLEILPNTYQHNIFESYLGWWGYLLVVNMLIYLETSSLQRVNIPKLQGVLRLMLRKTGKQWCKNPGIPSVDHGNWGWQCVWFIVCSLFVKNAAICEGLRLICSSHLQRWQPFSERFGPRMIMPENLQNEQSSCSFSWDSISHYEFVIQKHCDYWLEKQTIMLRSVPQMLKKWRIVVNRISKVRQTTCNWIKRILDEATRIGICKQ